MNKEPIDKLREDIVFNATLRGQPLTFHSTWGIFSPRAVSYTHLTLPTNREV